MSDWILIHWKQIDMWAEAIDNSAAWVAFFFSLLGIALVVILAAVIAFLALRGLWRLLVASTWNRFIVSLERKALRQ
jgi:hypothetical protein